jgi:hypothetical protein
MIPRMDSKLPISMAEQRERDTLLLRLLHTPPQPRPKRDRRKEDEGAPKSSAGKKTALKERVSYNEH